MSFQEESKKALKILENERVLKVVNAAREEFIEQGIMNAKIKNIAIRAGVGEASIYRYFTDKNELAKIVATHYWAEMFVVFKNIMVQSFEDSNTALDHIRSFLNIFITLYTDYPKFLIFTEDFDGYMSYVVNDEDTAQFSSMISDIKELFLRLITDGIKNNEIRDTVELDFVYSFVSQTMAATAQKLVSRIGYLHKEKENYGVKCLTDLIEMFINYIKKDYANA